MSTERESVIEKWAVKYALSKHGVRSTKLNTLGQRSNPDRLFWIPGGLPLLIEFKRPGEEPTRLQYHTISELREQGYDVQVHSNRNEIKKAIDNAVFNGRLRITAFV